MWRYLQMHVPLVFIKLCLVSKTYSWFMQLTLKTIISMPALLTSSITNTRDVITFTWLFTKETALVLTSSSITSKIAHCKTECNATFYITGHITYYQNKHLVFHWANDKQSWAIFQHWHLKENWNITTVINQVTFILSILLEINHFTP